MNEGDRVSTETNEHRKTKIVATVGPSSSSQERLEELIKCGVNVFRLNFSHSTHEDHLKVLTTIRQASEAVSLPVAILQDLGGPKIRITQLKDNFASINDGDVLTLRASVTTPPEESTGEVVYVRGLDPVQTVSVGDRILFADGIVELNVTEVSSSEATCQVSKGGRLRSRVGIAFPDSDIDLPATTEKDLKDLAWGIENNVDFIAVSFVKNRQDLEPIAEAIKAAKSHAQIISKIERKSSLDNLDGIFDLTDGIMVARGDLGLELPLEQLPRVQKDLIARANGLGLPVIVATQMLHSMVSSVRPTRAEVSDVATAVMSGADAVMLSEETAIGDHPIESVQYLNRIAREAERSFTYEEFRLRFREGDRKQTVSDAIAYAACAAAVKVEARAIIACTETGNTARLVAKYRPQQPLFGSTTRQEAVRLMCLYWGVQPILVPPVESHSEELESALKEVGKRNFLSDGDRAVVTGGLSVRTPGASSIIEICQFSK